GRPAKPAPMTANSQRCPVSMGTVEDSANAQARFSARICWLSTVTCLSNAPIKYRGVAVPSSYPARTFDEEDDRAEPFPDPATLVDLPIFVPISEMHPSQNGHFRQGNHAC